MKNISITSPLKPIKTIFNRFHMTLFIVFIAAGLGYAVMVFNTLLSESSTDTTYTSPIGAGTIDQTTLDRIKALHTSDEPIPAQTTLPGRTNPFSE
jgi:hypothetical protein